MSAADEQGEEEEEEEKEKEEEEEEEKEEKAELAAAKKKVLLYLSYLLSPEIKIILLSPTRSPFPKRFSCTLRVSCYDLQSLLSSSSSLSTSSSSTSSSISSSFLYLLLHVHHLLISPSSLAKNPPNLRSTIILQSFETSRNVKSTKPVEIRRSKMYIFRRICLLASIQMQPM